MSCGDGGDRGQHALLLGSCIDGYRIRAGRFATDVDHVLAIDWQTFAELAVENDVDATYRYGSAPVDQHDYLRLVLEGTLHAELRKQPLALYRALRTTASGVAIDDTWSVAELDLLVLHLRDLRSADISFAAAPR